MELRVEQAGTRISDRPSRTRDYLSACHITVVTIGNVAMGRWDQGVTLGPFLRGVFKRRMTGTLTDIHHQQGRCFTASVPEGLVCDAEARSKLILREDGTPIGPAHASHHDIREHGGGRYSHWAGHVYFSTPDGTDPRENGRTYSFRD